MSFLPQEQILIELRPFVVIVQHHLRVDERERHLVERRVELAVRRHEIAPGKNTLPLFADLEIIEQHCGVRMRRPPHDGDAVGSRHRRTDREPLDRRALPLELLRLVVVDRQRERHLARDHELRQQGMPPADGDAVRRDDFPEDAYAARLPELGEDPRKPIGLLRLAAELARHMFTFTPYFCSKAFATAPMSFACADVYRLSSPSFLAPAISFSSRSAPSYRAGFTCANAPAASALRTSASKGLTSINRYPFLWPALAGKVPTTASPISLTRR